MFFYTSQGRNIDSYNIVDIEDTIPLVFGNFPIINPLISPVMHTHFPNCKVLIFYEMIYHIFNPGFLKFSGGIEISSMKWVN